MQINLEYQPYEYKKRGKKPFRKEHELAEKAFALAVFDSFSFDSFEGFDNNLIFRKIRKMNDKEGTSKKIICRKHGEGQYKVMRIE